MTGSSATAAWGRRLRQAQPENVHFLDPEVLEPLARAAGERGVTLHKLIKTILVAWLRDQQKD
jgi:hypothetical protein